MEKGPAEPVFSGPEGIRFDFNYGCRVQVPVSGWRVKMVDTDTFTVLFNEHVDANAVIASIRKYYVRFLIEVFDGARRVFSHTFDPAGKQIRLRMPPWALGDTVAWLPAIDAFREKHRCKVHVPMGEHLQLLYQKVYPYLHLATEAQLAKQNVTYYATYYFGWITPFFERDHQPTDPRISSMQDTVAYQLGVSPGERKPPLRVADTERQVAERYVCIATQASRQRKYWNNPDGWPVLIDYLKSLGYRVLCIDRYWQYGDDEFTNTMPQGAEDFTGDRSLQDRVDMLFHADFFIGLGSGLSWLAWALDVPVVMINGFTHPLTEFHTPYRVINFHVCNSCLNDTGIEFIPDDFGRCPRLEDSPKRFQCTASITPQFVMQVVDRLIRDQSRARVASTFDCDKSVSQI